VALAGLLLVILGNLVSLMIEMEPPGSLNTLFGIQKVLPVELLLGMGIYILGLVMLYWGTQSVRGARSWAERLLLIVLPLGLPLVMMLPFIDYTIPVSKLYGFAQLWEPRVLGLRLD
jgi:hypothetical protein